MYSEQEARSLIIKAGLELIGKKLSAGTWGNISARISEEEFIITPSGLPYETIGENDLVKVRIDDLSFIGEHVPSVEKGLHAGIFAVRPDCNFVVHTHQHYASAICAEEKSVPFAPCAAYGYSGSEQLSKNVQNMVMQHPDHRTFLMAHHGAVCYGETYEDAFASALALEENCRKLWESAWHLPKPGMWLDDYAQMFDMFGRTIENEDRDAMRLVWEKNNAAACYVTTAHPITLPAAVKEHSLYVNKYSKMKDAVKKVQK